MGLNFNQHLWYSPSLKSHYYLTLGLGFSQIKHVATYFRKSTSGNFGYYIIDWKGAFERKEFNLATAIASLGLSIKSNEKKNRPCSLWFSL